MTINASDLLPVRTASCSVMGDYALKKKMTVPYSKAKKGDVVLYDFNGNGTSDHTGIIYKVSGGKIYVVEGNTSQGNNCNGGMVMKRARAKANVNYIIRPKYTAKVTADMIVATALAEVGVKESPKNSNNVKYNTWYYGHPVKGSAYPWCMVFVQWCFAHVKETKPKATATLKKPTGKYSGTIPTGTLKKGSKGTKVKQLQQFLNWYGIKCTCDSKFGDKTKQAVKKFQKTEGITQDGVYGSHSYSKAKAYKASAPKPAPKPTPAPAKATRADKGVAWARSIAKSGKYTYKKWNDKDKKTKQCPICHPSLKGKYKGWNCIGFVSAILHHGFGLKDIECSCKGIGTDSFFTKVTLDSWKKRNGKDWTMITNGGTKGGADIPASKLKAGDVLICYDAKGKFHHVVMYTGNGKYIDCTNTSKNHIAERAYTNLCKRYHVTRAFRYIGK